MGLAWKLERARKFSFFSFFFVFFIFFGVFVFTSGAYALYTLSFAKGLTAQNPCKFSVQAKKIDVQRRRITLARGI